MSKARVALLSLMAVCAMSALASSTASAAGTHQWILNGTPLVENGSEEIQGNNSPQQASQFEVTVAKLSVHIVCQWYLILTKEGNVIEGGPVGKVKAKVEFKGCSVYQITKAGVVEPLPECKIKEPIKAEAEGELTNAGELTLKPKEKIFSTVTIEKANKEAGCVVEGALNVELKEEKVGGLICPIPHYGVDVYIGTLSCAPGGSSLIFGKEPAKLYLQILIVLERGGKWHST